MDKKNLRAIEGMLNGYTSLVNEIKNISLDIEELKNDYRGCGSIEYSEKTGKTYKFNSGVENEIINREKKIENLEKLKRGKEIQVERVNNALEVLSENELKVIKFKYFDERKKSWTKVSYKMDMCEAWCRQLKDRAIKKMAVIIFVSEETSEKLAE